MASPATYNNATVKSVTRVGSTYSATIHTDDPPPVGMDRTLTDLCEADHADLRAAVGEGTVNVTTTDGDQGPLTAVTVKA